MPNLHVHQFEGAVTCEQAHTHIVAGVSGPPIRQGNTHIHVVQGLTTFKNMHHHNYSVYSGPEIELAAGMHTHQLVFETSYDDGHRHNFMDFMMASEEERY